MKLVEIKNISKIYHTKKNEILALKDISFDINNGDFIAIVGPSGCGKSTILSILCNLENKSGGSIIKDKTIKFGFMFQRDTLFDWMTIKDNCMLGTRIKKSINEDTIKYCDDLLKSYGLYEFKDSYPRELSGGMRQRVALIRTLMLKPDILLLDEPFGTYMLVLIERSTNVKCKHFSIRTKKGIKYYYCRLHKNEVSLKCNYNCNDKEYKEYKVLSKRTKKQNKKEKQRFSIICRDMSKCVVCGSNWLITTHEIFGGSNRSNSMLYGLTIPLCLECHSKYQNNKSFNDKWHIIGQTAFEKYYPNLEFVKIFYKNYKK